MTVTAAVGRRVGDLEPSVSQLLEVLNAASEAFVDISDGGVITGWNTAAHTLMGWSAEQAVGRRFVDTIVAASHREACDRVLVRSRDESAEQSAQTVEWMVVHRDGHLLCVHGRVGRHRSSGTWHSHAFLRDGTAEPAAARSASRAAALRRTTVESGGEVISRHGPDGCILSVSHACRQMLGFGPDELVGKQWREFVHPDDLATLYGADGDLLTTIGSQRMVTARLRRRDGGWT